MIDAKYNLQDEKPHFAILLSLSHEVLYEDADEETTSGVWKNLKKIFENVKVKIDDEDAALILLVSFPPSFENFVNFFIVGKDTITLDYILVIIEKRKAIGGLIVLSLRKKVKAVVAKDDLSSERDVVSLVVYYKGETITSSASVSCFKKSNSDLTMLWHMRLGYVSEKVAEQMESLELTTYREAITSKEYGMWIETMGEEIESIHKNNTWELVKL
ncbi:hypothetical protein Tco_0397183 [Tanacetum coccineum]